MLREITPNSSSGGKFSEGGESTTGSSHSNKGEKKWEGVDFLRLSRNIRDNLQKDNMEYNIDQLKGRK